MLVTAGKAFMNVAQDGVLSAPRGKNIMEVMFYQTIVDYPFHNFTFRKRDNLDYIKREFQWYLHGEPMDDRICKYAQIWETIKQPSGRIFSNYGYYWFQRGNPDGMSAFQYVVETLSSDPDSRQAYMPMLGKQHIFKGNKDVVCTKGILFRISDGVLLMHVAMRSSDLAIGSSIDWPCFSFLHEMMAFALNIPIGQFIFSTDSLHVYEKDFDYMNQVIASHEEPNHGLDGIIDPPPITDIADLLNEEYKSPFGQWLTTVKL